MSVLVITRNNEADSGLSHPGTKKGNRNRGMRQGSIKCTSMFLVQREHHLTTAIMSGDSIRDDDGLQGGRQGEVMVVTGDNHNNGTQKEFNRLSGNGK